MYVPPLNAPTNLLSLVENRKMQGQNDSLKSEPPKSSKIPNKQSLSVPPLLLRKPNPSSPTWLLPALGDVDYLVFVKETKCDEFLEKECDTSF
jgi:hypothetical protein